VRRPPYGGRSLNIAADSARAARAKILLAFRHALRVSELVDVSLEQIDLKVATIHIRRAKNGTPGIHGLQGDELRLIRALLRENPAQPIPVPVGA
jgi:integrase